MSIACNASWPPLEHIDEEGVYRGLAADYVALLESHLQMTFPKKVFHRWDTLLSSIEKGEVSVVAAIQKTAERESFLLFSDPYLTVPVALITKKGYNLASENELSKMKIAGVNGYAVNDYLEKKYPNVELTVYKDDLTALMQTVLGNCDGTVIDLPTASFLVRKYGLSNLELGCQLEFSWVLSFGVSREYPELINLINSFLNTIPEPQKNEIYASYINLENLEKLSKLDKIIDNLWILLLILLIITLIAIGYITILKRKNLNQVQKAYDQLNFHYINTPLAIVEWDNRFIIRKWSIRAEGLFEWTASEVEGRHFDDFSFVHEADLQKVNKAVQTMMGGTVDRFTIMNRNYTKSGKTIFCKWHNSILKNKSGQVLSIFSFVENISDIKKAEQFLRETSEVGNVGGWEIDLITKKNLWSSITRKIFDVDDHYEPDLDNAINFYKEGTSRNRIRQFVSDAVDKGMPWDAELEIISAKGIEKWVRTRGRVELQHDKTVRLYGMVRDITYLKQKESYIAYKSKLLEALTKIHMMLLENREGLEVLSHCFRIVGETIEADRVYYFKKHKDSLTGKSLISQVLEWHNPEADAQINNPLLQNMSFDYEPDLYNSLLERKHFSAIISQLNSSHLRSILEEQQIQSILIFPVYIDDHFEGFIGIDDCRFERLWTEDEVSILKNLSMLMAIYLQRKQAEKQIIESNKRYEYATSATLDAIWEMDLQSREVIWAKGYEDHFGYRDQKLPAEIVFVSRIHPNDRKQVIDSFQTIIKNGYNLWSAEYRYLKADGNYVQVSDRCIILRNNEGIALKAIGAMRDISERIKYINAIKDQNKNLREIAWMQSHLLRAPVAKLLGLLDLFNRDFVDDIKKQKILTYIHESAKEIDLVIGKINDKTFKES
ncbi:MAG: transporter substrate-binding domain-containing protein [Cyclobacteriaceae bacterium]|nr:transporter substrate-binding domain-containing protein [Cyclobacteriaceae bacterium]